MNDRLGNPGEFPFTRGVYRDRLRQAPSSRNRTAVDAKLAALEEAARSGAKLMPPIL